MRQAIGYIRVSTLEQANEGISLEAQQARIERWCEANDYQLAALYVDRGISGKRMDNRKDLQRALATLKKDMVLVVHSLSRLARSTKDALHLCDLIGKKKADLVSLSESLDTTTAMGRAMFQFIAVMAELERNLIAERTAAALAHKRKKGEVYSPVPFGFREIEGRLEVVEAEALVVAEIKRQRQTGSTLVEIADYLNGQGIEGKKGGRWYASTVRYLLYRQEVAAAA